MRLILDTNQHQKMSGVSEHEYPEACSLGHTWLLLLCFYCSPAVVPLNLD